MWNRSGRRTAAGRQRRRPAGPGSGASPAPAAHRVPARGPPRPGPPSAPTPAPMRGPPSAPTRGADEGSAPADLATPPDRRTRRPVPPRAAASPAQAAHRPPARGPARPGRPRRLRRRRRGSLPRARRRHRQEAWARPRCQPTCRRRGNGLLPRLVGWWRAWARRRRWWRRDARRCPCPREPDAAAASAARGGRSNLLSRSLVCAAARPRRLRTGLRLRRRLCDPNHPDRPERRL